jgi:hypothetical protein
LGLAGGFISSTRGRFLDSGGGRSLGVSWRPRSAADSRSEELLELTADDEEMLQKVASTQLYKNLWLNMTAYPPYVYVQVNVPTILVRHRDAMLVLKPDHSTFFHVTGFCQRTLYSGMLIAKNTGAYANP